MLDSAVTLGRYRCICQLFELRRAVRIADCKRHDFFNQLLRVVDLSGAFLGVFTVMAHHYVMAHHLIVRHI